MDLGKLFLIFIIASLNKFMNLQSKILKNEIKIALKNSFRKFYMKLNKEKEKKRESEKKLNGLQLPFL